MSSSSVHSNAQHDWKEEASLFRMQFFSLTGCSFAFSKSLWAQAATTAFEGYITAQHQNAEKEGEEAAKWASRILHMLLKSRSNSCISQSLLQKKLFSRCENPSFGRRRKTFLLQSPFHKFPCFICLSCALGSSESIGQVGHKFSAAIKTVGIWSYTTTEPSFCYKS